MRKFALYYGVTRKGEREILGFGPRSEIQDLKAQCIKDLSDDKMCRKYKGLILATDYGLKNSYKPVHPEADKLALEEQEAAAKADQLAQDKALVDSKKKAASEKKAKDAQIKEDQDALAAEEKDAEDRLKAAEKKATKTGAQISESDKATKKEDK